MMVRSDSPDHFFVSYLRSKRCTPVFGTLYHLKSCSFHHCQDLRSVNYICNMGKQRIRIFTVPETKVIPIKRIIHDEDQHGFFQLKSTEIIFRISIKPKMKLESVKMNINLESATMSFTAEKGFIYVAASTKESAVTKFINSITNEKAIKLAQMHGFDDDELNDLHFPDEKNPDAEIPHPDKNEVM